MKSRRRKRCKHCNNLFHPDPRNRRHQRYCSSSQCRNASKKASHKRWLSKAENRDYYRGAEAVEKTQQWRVKNPGYWRKITAGTLQDVLEPPESTQATENTAKNRLNKRFLTETALQELLSAETPLFVGLLAHLCGSTLLDDIESHARGLLRLSHDICQQPGGSDDSKTSYLSRAGP